MLREARERKRGLVWVLEILVFLALFAAASAVESVPVSIGTVYWLFSDGTIINSAAAALMNGDVFGYVSEIMRIVTEQPQWLMLITLFSTALMIVVCVLFCRVIQKRGLGSMGFRRGHIVREYLVGALVGAGMISATILLGVLFGFYKISFAKPNWALFVLFLLGYFVQGMSEEVLCRSCLMVSLSRRNPLWLSILLSSLMFALLHVLNPGFGILPFIDILLTGGIFAVWTLKRGNIWGACAMHTFWNFFLGNVFGFSVSGTNADTGASLLIAETVGNASDFGPEGDLVGTAVLVIVFALVLFVMRPAKEIEEQ